MKKLFDFSVNIADKTCEISITQAGIDFIKLMGKAKQIESMKNDFNSILQKTIDKTLKVERTDLQ